MIKNSSARRLLMQAVPYAMLAMTLASPLASAAPGALAETGIARGVLRAEREAVLSSSVSERILGMPYKEGDKFAKGAGLVSFDCGRMAAELRAARAGESVETRNYKVQTELLTMEATGKADADIAGLKEKERQAQAQVIEQRMVGCKVVAPFSGRVVETTARVHETPPPNEKLIRIVSDGPLELHMVVPSKWLSWLQTGSTFDFKVDETGDVLQAKVQRISAGVDAVSQTIKVVATVPKVPAKVLPGMSGRATLDDKASLASSSAKPAPVAAAVTPVVATTTGTGALRPR